MSTRSNVKDPVHAIMTKQFWSKCRLRIVFPKQVNPVIYGMEYPHHTYNHVSIIFSIQRFVVADFNIYCFV